MVLKGTAWKPIGPSPIATASSRFDNGIVTSIAVHPANPSIVLFHLHANVWWGAILAAFGALYCYKFAPKRQS